MERCIGCGAEFGPIDGPVHPYMTSSPACWAAFGRILAAEYSDPRLMAVHRLSVDAYAVQHPGESSRQAVQSVGLHLARLYLQLERNILPGSANDAMLNLGKRKSGLPLLARPPSFSITVADVAPVAGTTEHEAVVRDWARSAWDAWTHVHDFIRNWATEEPWVS